MTQERRPEKKSKAVERSNKGGEKNRSRRDRELPASKVVIRRLPPSLTQETFLEQISPVPEHDYFQFVKADYSLGLNAFSRAYINFVKQEDIIIFQQKFDGYVFVDSKGNEFTAIVEFAPFQKVPKKKAKKVDSKKGTIESDLDYQKFLAQLTSDDQEPQILPESYLEEIEAREKEMKANHGVLKMSTPLIDYIRRKKEEKRVAIQKARDDRKRKEKQKEDERRRKKERDRDKQREKDRAKMKDGKDKKKWDQDVPTKVVLLKNSDRDKDVLKYKDAAQVSDAKGRVTSSRDSKVKPNKERDREKHRESVKAISSRGESARTLAASSTRRDKPRGSQHDRDQGKSGGSTWEGEGGGSSHTKDLEAACVADQVKVKIEKGRERRDSKKQAYPDTDSLEDAGKYKLKKYPVDASDAASPSKPAGPVSDAAPTKADGSSSDTPANKASDSEPVVMTSSVDTQEPGSDHCTPESVTTQCLLDNSPADAESVVSSSDLQCIPIQDDAVVEKPIVDDETSQSSRLLRGPSETRDFEMSTDTASIEKPAVECTSNPSSTDSKMTSILNSADSQSGQSTAGVGLNGDKTVADPGAAADRDCGSLQSTVMNDLMHTSEECLTNPPGGSGESVNQPESVTGDHCVQSRTMESTHQSLEVSVPEDTVSEPVHPSMKANSSRDADHFVDPSPEQSLHLGSPQEYDGAEEGHTDVAPNTATISHSDCSESTAGEPTLNDKTESPPAEPALSDKPATVSRDHTQNISSDKPEVAQDSPLVEPVPSDRDAAESGLVEPDLEDKCAVFSEGAFVEPCMSDIASTGSESPPVELVLGDKHAPNTGSAASDAIKEALEATEKGAMGGAAENQDRASKGSSNGKQRVRYRDRPDRAIYNPAKRAAERRAQQEARKQERDHKHDEA